jgi:two-component system sensor histidine kinase RegB
VAVHNRPEGGAIVAITLPLAAVVLEEEDEDEETQAIGAADTIIDRNARP